MKCPYCKEDMKMGYIQSARPFFWGEKKHRMFFVETEEGEIKLSKGFWNGAFAKAFHCDKCKKIIMDVNE